MRIEGFFYVLAFLLLALDSVLLFLSSQLNTISFCMGEGLILSILIYLIFFYCKIVKPLNTIGGGMELLCEQDFSNRFSPVGQYEADRVVNIFNRMVEQLKNERLRPREQNNFLDLLIKASPMGVIVTSLDEDLSELNSTASKMLGVCLKDVQGKKMKEADSPLAVELTNLPKGERATVCLDGSDIYRCAHSSSINYGSQHPSYLVETLTDEVMKAKRKTYEKVIRMIVHEVNSATAGVISTLNTIEQAFSSEEGVEDICDVVCACTDRCSSMGRFVIRFADVVKISEPTLSFVNLNDLVFTCKRFMERMYNDHHITLRMEMDESLKDMVLGTALLEQVPVNIIRNVAESIETDGEIIVHTLAPATVKVIDNDQGISRETEAKLLSPFFSTKPNDQGIGLIFTREILMRHGYTLSLRTYAGGPARFHITFP